MTNYYKKYLKYRTKYFNLKKQQGGLNNDTVKLVDLPENFKGPFPPRKLQKIRERFNGMIDIDTDNYLCVHDNNTNFNKDYYFIKKNNLELLDDPNTSIYYDKIKNILEEYPNMNQYIAIAPGTIKEFYIPSFIKEYLTKNVDERFIIIIINKNINYGAGYNLNADNINSYIGEEKKEAYGDRLNIVHIYINFFFNHNSDQFEPFLNSIYRPNKLNIIYTGFRICGQTFELEFNPNNYLVIGCNGYRYNDRKIYFTEPVLNYNNDNIEFFKNEQKCGNVVPRIGRPNNLINMPQSCKISLEMVNNIMNP